MSVFRTLAQRGHDPIGTVVTAVEQFITAKQLPSHCQNQKPLRTAEVLQETVACVELARPNSSNRSGCGGDECERAFKPGQSVGRTIPMADRSANTITES